MYALCNMYVLHTNTNKSLLKIKIVFTTKLFHGSYRHVELNYQLYYILIMYVLHKYVLHIKYVCMQLV